MRKYFARLVGASKSDVLPGLPFHRDFFGIMVLIMISVMFTMGVGMIVVSMLEAGVSQPHQSGVEAFSVRGSSQPVALHFVFNATIWYQILGR